MIDQKKDLSFEEALKQLELAAEALKKSDVTLDQALQNFQDGIGYYEYCTRILQDARQKIMTYQKGQEDLS